MGSAYLETPQFGGDYTPQLKFELSTYYDSRTTIHVDWVLRYEQYGVNPHWGTMWAWCGYNSDDQVTLVEFQGDGDDKELASGSFTVNRAATGFSVPVWLSCDMSDCYFGGSYGEEWTGDNCIGGDYFGVNPIDPPNAPRSISASRGANNNTVTVTLDNAVDADGSQIEVSADKATWTSFRDTTTGGAITTYTGTVPSSLSGSVFFRARNYASGVYSDWSPVSTAVQLLGAPNPPTLLGPRDGAVFEYGSEIKLTWRHNPTDGTAQVGYYANIDGIDRTYGDMSKSEAVLGSTFALGQHYWRIRTRGTASAFSQYSETRTFTVAYAPEASFEITSIRDGKQRTMPVTFSVRKSGGTDGRDVVGVTARLYDGSKLLATKEVHGGSSSFFGMEDFSPDNNKHYAIKITVRNEYGLTASVVHGFDTEFPAIMQPNVTVSSAANDSKRVLVGYFMSNAGGGSAKAFDASAMADAYDLYREVNGKRALIGSGSLKDGATGDGPLWHVDQYIPLVREYKYVVVAHRTTDGTSATFSFDFLNGSSFSKWYIHYGNKLLTKQWNPSGSWGLTRPQKTRIQYDGRKLPVSYDGVAVERTMSQTFELLTIDEVRQVEDLIESGGRGYYRSCDGFAGWVDVDVSFSPKYTDSGHYGTCTFKMTQIDGDAL